MACSATMVLLLMSGLLLAVISLTLKALSSSGPSRPSSSVAKKDTAKAPPERPKSENSPRYLLFDRHYGGDRAQGIGNVMNGLLAAHLLGDEYGRIVCAHWEAFELAFSSKTKECEQVDWSQTKDYPHILSWNFGTTDNECQLVEKLASSHQFVTFTGNTYPKWSVVKDGYFEKFYEPTERLSRVLPWEKPPSTVVHLRRADGAVDFRKGMDEKTFLALGRMLAKEEELPYLVTNDVSLYDFFSEKYKWETPHWGTVTHSARYERQLEGASKKETRGKEKEEEDDDEELSDENAQMLHLYADWYSIVKAKNVYHTHSDFSLSAVHWMNNRRSRTILGLVQDGKQGEVNLVEEPWIRDGETPPLVTRDADDLTDVKGNPCARHGWPDRAMAARRISRYRQNGHLM